MTRSAWKGPRSVTRTVTALPVWTLVTRTYEGRASVGWAAVIANMS